MAESLNPMNPQVSIVLSVKDGAEYLSKCLASIKNQTFQDYEIVTINDGSVDTTGDISLEWQRKFNPGQMHIITHASPEGLTKSLNEGIRTSKGAYIARIDADDWWHVAKLEKQVNFLHNHPAVGIVGTFYANVREHKRQPIQLPRTPNDIRSSIFRKNPFGHSCVLIRKELLEAVGGYNEALRYGQDRDLWYQLLPLTDMANIPETLCYRAVGYHSTTPKKQQIWQNIRTTSRYILAYKVSPVNFLYLIEPLTMLMAPAWLKRYVRKLL